MKIYIGIPSNGHILPPTVSSLLRLHNALTHRGHEIATDLSTTSVLPKMRNEMAGKALDSGAEVLLFIDSDVSFDPPPMVHLVESDKDVSVCAYRRKEDAESYTCQIESGLDGRPRVEDGWVELSAAGTGMMAIKTTVIKDMYFAYPELEYISDNDEKRVALFDFMVYDGRYRGEDYTFCRRWREIGGQIWLWPDVTTTHNGNFGYTGNIADFLIGEKNAQRSQAVAL